MAKKMLIETGTDEVRVAIVEDGQLVDYDIELRSDTTIKGNVYKGIITNVERSLAAVFVDFGANKQGFLPFSEIFPEALLDQPKSDKAIADLLHRHQEIIVQVTRDEMGHKGAALTSYLSFAGRYCVLMYSDDGHGGVSRKIVDEKARKKAKETLSKLKIPEGLGVIVRTAGMDRTKTELQRDLSTLIRTWKSVHKSAKLGRAPTLLYREPDIVVRTIRDYLLPDINEIIIDDPDEFEDAGDFFNDTMPRQKDLLSLYQDKLPLLTSLGVEDQISQTLSRTVRLPSGGEIVIDQTEALVAIDVNSARSTKEKDHEETVYKTNLEAAVEVARQLRLRDMGGIVVIDFIDHAQSKHDRAVEKAIKDALKVDKAKTSVGRISSHGTLELTRQRLRRAHSLSGSSLCPVCGGSGRVLDPGTRAQTVLRELRRRSMQDPHNIETVSVQIDVDTANLILNEHRDQLIAIERSSAVKISVMADVHAPLGEAQYKESKRNRRLSDVAYQAMLDQLAPRQERPQTKSEPLAKPNLKLKKMQPNLQTDSAALESDLQDSESSSTLATSTQGEANKQDRQKSPARNKRAKRGHKENTPSLEADKNEPSSSSRQKTKDATPKPASKSAQLSKTAIPEPEKLARPVPVSEDPLTEALFGPGPLDPKFKPSFVEHNANSDTAQKKKRRRRRRKPKTAMNNEEGETLQSTQPTAPQNKTQNEQKKTQGSTPTATDKSKNLDKQSLPLTLDEVKLTKRTVSGH